MLIPHHRNRGNRRTSYVKHATDKEGLRSLSCCTLTGRLRAACTYGLLSRGSPIVRLPREVDDPQSSNEVPDASNESGGYVCQQVGLSKGEKKKREVTH